MKAGYPLGVLWGYNAASTGEHSTGRALDFMVTHAPALITTDARRAAGDFIADYLWTHRDRLGLIHEIWRQRIRSTVRVPGVWRTLADRGSTTANHMDHVHVYLSGVYAPPAPQPGQGAPAGPVIVPTPPLGGLLVVDGDWGSRTSREVSKRLGITDVPHNMGRIAIITLQHTFRTPVDGIVSDQRLMHHLYAWSDKRIKIGRGGSRLIRDMAADLEVAGYNTRGTAVDGLAGPGFVSAVQRRLNNDPTYLLKG